MDTMFSHLHASSWAIMILLFFITYFLIKGGKAKAGKILHMVLRLFYVVMVVSGGYLLFSMFQYGFPTTFFIKALLALVLIGMMEMILTKTKKNTLNKPLLYWLIFIITVIIVPLIGLRVI
ncbi:DUF1516 family protein [Alkalihalobacillus trypoxylicola]|uniref:UPF0344 protein AZF04_06130 n=1 Tax=Alkalihalobacillus trypoxylicola TaxID=519424 RepID=A0A161Q778_9BACI|nr:DUF1516 family protein [Alkalihalobacillus trypoxylicola]KYG32338.1 hypothetical protein AZF04_06130 [Alkalihalobacillus trypoxylicola]GAF64042.1 hypothetical protein BTS2_0934 [Bacillus sp. TS-2]